MKRMMLAILFAGLSIPLVGAISQPNKTAQQRRAQLEAMLKDSTTMNMMLDHIVADQRWRMSMMHKLADFAGKDSLTMTAMRKLLQGGSEASAAETTEEEILIKFKADASPAQIKALEAEFGLRQVKEIPALRVRVFRFSSSRTAKDIIAASVKRPFVEYAEPNYKVNAKKK